jgi:hypothetical protein
MSLLTFLRNRARARRSLKNEEKVWTARDFAAPSPSWIKRRALLRLGMKNATWVETGTFMGDTTALLAAESEAVYTIEPDASLFEKASNRFSGDHKIRVIHGLSENVFPQLLPTLNGRINFWLDGHYSGGITHKGPIDCPVRQELANIQEHIRRFESIVVLIDDMRCFDPSVPEYADYPSIDYLVDWARANHLGWHIEHDIFVAKSKLKAT